MNLIADYMFTIQIIGYRPFMERFAYYLLPILPLVVFFTSMILGCRGQKVRKIFYALVIAALLSAAIFFLKLPLPGHRAEYSDWEGIKVWGIVPSQGGAVIAFVTILMSLIMLLAGYGIGTAVFRRKRKTIRDKQH